MNSIFADEPVTLAVADHEAGYSIPAPGAPTNNETMEHNQEGGEKVPAFNGIVLDVSSCMIYYRSGGS